MQLPDEAPKLPKLPFLIGDGALLATAWFIASRSEAPLQPSVLIAIVGCVALGAILAVIPFIAEYARKQEASLQERQNALEALSRTTTTAAEQISIAASGLHTIADLAQKSLKAAEQLGPKLQEKINDFARRADEALVAENEALTQEVNALRASDAEKLETATDKIRTTAAELAKLEAATHKHLAAVGDTLARLPSLAEEASQKATGIASETARATLAQLLTEIDIRIAAAATRLAAVAPNPAPTALTVSSDEASSSEPALPASTAAEATAEPKRKRSKPTLTEDSAETQVVTADTAPIPPSEPAPEPASEAAVAAPAATPDPVPEVAPAPEEPVVAVAVVEPAPSPASETPVAESNDAPLPSPDEAAEASSPRPARKAKKSISTSAPPFIPGLLNSDAPLTRPGGDFSSLESGEGEPEDLGGPPIDRAISADGLTRLIATAYIGIGNKLYLRGDGPGLSWDKGVPLQFVSIGKWRWETADATAPFSAKLYKNDQIECTSLGSLTLDPGQQTEVNASF